MCDNNLKNDCSCIEPKNDIQTASQIGLAYSPEQTVMYEKQPPSRIPILRLSDAYKATAIYIPSDGLKTTYSRYC